ncbi:MAG: hypothetical protein U0174_23370 [Polyangiaceae bacterium]
MTGKLRLRTALALVAALGSVLAIACTSTSAAQCVTDSECDTILKAQAGSGRCNAGVCSVFTPPFDNPDAAPLTVCESTEKCKQLHPGERWACLEPQKKDCVKLESAECRPSDNWDRIIPDSQPFFIGDILPMDQKQPDGTTAPDEFWTEMANATELFRREWQSTTNGILVGPRQDPQPVVTFTCNTKGDPAKALASVDFLASIGVPAVMVGQHIEAKVILSKLVQNNMFAFCSNCYGADFTAAETKGLLYHDYPDEPSSIAPLAKIWVKEMETRRKAANQVANPPNLRVAYMSTDTTILQLRAKGVIDAIEFNGKPARQQPNDFLQITTVKPGDGIINWDTEVAKLVPFKPDLIFLAFGDATATDIIPRIEATWPNGVPKPHYIVGATEYLPDLLGNLLIGKPDLMKRLVGIGTAAPASTDDNYFAYLDRSKAAFGKEPSADANYEMGYVLANAMVAAVNDPQTLFGKMTGKDIARNIGFVVDQQSTHVINTTPSQIKEGVNFLKVRPITSIKQLGIYSEFDFDPATGIQKFDASLWCPQMDENNKFVLSDVIYYQYKTKSLDKPFDPLDCKW